MLLQKKRLGLWVVAAAIVTLVALPYAITALLPLPAGETLVVPVPIASESGAR